MKKPLSLATHLTLWYAGIFAGTLLFIFLVVYLLLNKEIRARTDQELIDRYREISTLVSTQGIDSVSGEFTREALAEGLQKIYFRIFDIQGKLIASSNLEHWKALTTKTCTINSDLESEPQFDTESLKDLHDPVRVLHVTILGKYHLEIGRSLDDDEEFFEAFKEKFVIALLIALVAAGLGGLFMAQRATKGIATLTKVATEIAQGNMTLRVAMTGSDEEIDRLANAFNTMVEQLQGLIKEMKEINDNIAHDLRSPFTRIRGLLEMMLISAQLPKEIENNLVTIMDECNRLIQLINTMLEISQAESKMLALNKSEFELGKVVQEICELFRPAAEDRGIQLTSPVVGDSRFFGDSAKIHRVISNLLDNAIKFTGAGGNIHVSIENREKQIVLAVQDTGIGIPEKDLSRIFDRFYRVDDSRSKPGNGLGLSLVKAFVDLHSGKIDVESGLGKGSRFVVTFPIEGAPGAEPKA